MLLLSDYLISYLMIVEDVQFFSVIVSILLLGTIIYITNNQSSHHYTSTHFQVSNIIYNKFDIHSSRLSYNITIFIKISNSDKKQLYTHNDISLSMFNISVGSRDNISVHLNPGELISVKLSLSKDNIDLPTNYFINKNRPVYSLLSIRSSITSRYVEQQEKVKKYKLETHCTFFATLPPKGFLVSSDCKAIN